VRDPGPQCPLENVAINLVAPYVVGCLVVIGYETDPAWAVGVP
jgi:hypothetical protein